MQPPGAKAHVRGMRQHQGALVENLVGPQSRDERRTAESVTGGPTSLDSGSISAGSDPTRAAAAVTTDPSG